MSTTYHVDYKQINDIIKKTGATGVELENILNSYLEGYAPDKIKSSITNLLPVSSKKKGKHAKTSNPFEHENWNLGVRVKAKKRFYYLVFPNDGTGTSKNNQPLQFMEHGLENILPEMTEEMVDFAMGMLGY